MEVYVFPLARAQRRLWYQEMIQSSNIAYNIPIALRLVGKLDQGAIEKAFCKIISRHEILRTTFAMENGEPIQLIHADIAFHIEQKTIEDLPEQKEELLRKHLAEESQKPFNLVKDPLIRAILYRLTEQEHVLFVNMHHIISDGWSLGIFVREFTEFYTAYIHNSHVSLPDLPIQYVDYAEWQEQWLNENEIQKQFVYWQRTLAQPLPVLDLPLDRLRSPRQTFHGAVVREPLPNALKTSLEKLATEEDATFFIIALAAYQILLYRYSGQTDIIVGSPIANRKQSELENLIGFFVNTLALRSDLSGKPTFRQFLQQTLQTCLEAYTHQDVPFEMLVEKLEGKRDPSRSPIFQTLFAVQNAPLDKIYLPGLTVTHIPLDNGGAKFDISLILEPADDGWLATLEYNTDLFTEDTAQRMLKHYRRLLNAAVANPDICINALPLLTENERHQLLALGSALEPINNEPKNLVDLFAQSVRFHGNRVAVKALNKTLTYKELDQRSNQLAYFLKQKGVTTETRVGIFQERSEALLVSLLAVLKAGGTYVPLEPAYPEERLRFIVEDSGVAFVITEAALLSSLPSADVEVIIPDSIESFAHEEQFVFHPQKIHPNQAAYIIYTSGSTGKPKGCVVAHSNVSRLLQSTEPWFGFNHNDVWTLFHSFAFDFSVWEIWGALLYGGKLVVVPYLQSRSPEAFRTLLSSEGVTILNQTPSAFRQLIRVDQEADDKLVLRAVIFGGESLELQSLRPWIERYGDQYPRLINMYGITETTVHVTYRLIRLEDVEQNCGSVIGTPIPDLSLYILDEELEPVPVGVPGEVYVGGMGVSRGYLNRPTLTAQRFIPDPFSQKLGVRLYRTGDLARRLSNGDLEYLGRGDQQVKVRGFRIELGEIEAALANIPEIAEAVVITYLQNEDDKRLVAYLVPNGDPPNRSDLRAVLKECLPDYMIPGAFVFLDAMPLTAQGKVDRRALPAPNWNDSAARHTIIPPQTPAEKIICQVWEEVLGIDTVGIEDNYFELGGDSISALKVIAQMRRQGWEVKAKDVFQHQTIKELAAVAKMLNSVAPVAERVVGEAPLSPIQKWFFELDIPNPNHWNQAVLLEVNQSLDSQVILAAVRTISLHHDIFRVRFDKKDRWRQFYTENDSNFAFETIDLSTQNQEQQNATMRETCANLQRSLDLSQGPLARAALFQLGTVRPNRLFIVIHHLIIDGVSWQILLEDLADAINGNFVTPSTTSFKNWSNFLQSFVNSPTIQQEQQFWWNSLKETKYQLPLDYPQNLAKNVESSVNTISLTFTEADTETFLTKANKAYHTQPQELLLAALAKTLKNWAGKDLQIMMEGHGREELSTDLDLTRTLGWFTALYPLRLNLSSCTDNETLIKSIKEQMRAVPGRGLGYGILRYLQGNTEIASSLAIPLPADISCNYLGQVRSEAKKNNLFRLLSNEDTGLLHDPIGLRPHLIDIIGIVIEGKLQVKWLYSSDLHREETILKWAEDFQENLLDILTHCIKPGVGEYTPSDFPLVNIDQSSLSRLQAKFAHLEDIYPLSPLQEGMLFHTLYTPENGVYFEQVTGRITGAFNVTAFNVAWQTVVDRHSILRSAFVWEGQKHTVQVVSEFVDFSVIQQDWRNLPPSRQDEELSRYLAEDRKQGFLLEQPPLMRFAIIRLDESTWQWVWSHHHLLLDGWSLPLLFKEVLMIYESTLHGFSCSLPSVPPYRNYIQWLASRDSQQAEEFWRENLAGIDEPTRLLFLLPEQDSEVPKDRAAYEKEELRLSPGEFASLQKMVQNYHLTLNTLAQGSWALLLQKYSARQDVLFGVTVSGRPPDLPDIENMIGLFINTLPLRVRLNPTLTVADWLQEIQQRHMQMREYEYSKLTDIHQAIAFPAGEPLFESILVFENYPINESLKNQGQNIKVDNIQFYERTNYPLTIAFVPDDGLLLRLNYETKFLSPKAAKILLQGLKNLLLKLALHPDVTLGTIELLSAEERQLAIETWNTNSMSWGDFRAAHELFEDQVDVNFNNIAVVCGENSLTYGELERKTNILASILKAEGINHEDIVGLYFEPTIDFVVALLAVLKAGAAFLPIDPAYPEERLKLILQDSQACLILAQAKPELPFLQSHSRVMTLANIDWTKKTRRLNLKTTPSHLAYVIYTSGSAGQPKGVLVTHKGIQNLVRAQTSTFGVTKESRVYQFASLSFDAAISEIFMALGSGASLYLKSKAERTPGPALWSALTAWQITHLTLPPSLLAALDLEELPQLQTLIVAGEAASLSLLQRWGGEGRKVFNAYGPTETTVCASMINCSHFTSEPSIGRAITNKEMYLLDPNLEPVVPGVAGEIYIGGVGLARGYLNQPSLTAAAFIPHPFAKESGARLYRTGDIGVYDQEGNIRFVGRQDNRVKYHGHRIELGEIEVALTKHKAVDSAVVLLREDVPGRQRLVAYALVQTEKVSSKDLLEHLSKILPAYMVPNTVVLVEQWSLTSNGKIDRQALPVPELPTPQLGATSLISANQTEAILCTIWAEVLGLETVHPDNNFFELGGDSIISLQIVSRAREAGLDINPKDIFEAQTLSRLAAIAKPFSKPIEVIEPLTGNVPLAPIQHWFFEQNLPQQHQWNQVLALSISESLDTEALLVALEAVAIHHDALRLGFMQKQGVWEQFYSGLAVKPSLRIKDFSSYPYYLQPYFLQLVVDEEQAHFRLNTPPLLRVLYAKNLEEYGDVLYLFGHHLIFDGVSWRILIEDLSQAYHQAVNKKPVSLPLKTSSYRQWTTALESLANSPEIEKDISYWQEILSNSVTIPVDYEVYLDSNIVESMVIESVQLSSTETLILLQEATTIYHARIEEILLAALLKTLTDWNNSLQLLVDLEGHGRDDLGSGLDLSRTVGWFTSVYPILLNIPEKNVARETLLKEVKKQMRGLPHHGISFGLLRYLHKDKSLQKTLINANSAQVSFNYLGQVDNQHKSKNLFNLSNAPVGAGMFAKQKRPHLLAINARVQNECLQVEWSYSKYIHRAETIHHLAENYLNNLRSYLQQDLIYCPSFYANSDFRLIDLSETELDSILEDLED